MRGCQPRLVTDETGFIPPEGKGVEKVWEGDSIPGAESQRTHFESAKVAGEVGEDRFHRVTGDAAGQIVCGSRL